MPTVRRGLDQYSRLALVTEHWVDGSAVEINKTGPHFQDVVSFAPFEISLIDADEYPRTLLITANQRRYAQKLVTALIRRRFEVA
jgi:hypothetical protein